MSVQLVVASGSRSGQAISIPGDRFVIGRADDCNLKPRSELISRYHCEISQKDGNVFVRDMGSKNGVFLNDEKISETCELKNGDRITVGPLEFYVQILYEGKPQKPAKVKSVSEAVARTVALQSENAQKNQEDAIADWLRPEDDVSDEDEMETRTIDASELMAHLQTQSEAANREREEQEEAGQTDGVMRPGAAASSRDAASELLRKFFKGGK